MPIDPAYLHLVHQGPFPAIIYGRASRDPKKRGRSVADQVLDGRRLCNAIDAPIVHVYDGDVDRSASRTAKKVRDDFELLIADIEAKRCRLVVAADASRYYRELDIYVRLRKACMVAGVFLSYGGVIYDMNDPTDRQITAQHALKAEGEADDITARNLRTVRLNAEKMRPHGKLLWGYARKYDEDTGELLKQFAHPIRGPIVTEAFERAASGAALYAIAVWINKHPDTERHSGKRWDGAAVLRMLRNPAYVGRRIFQGEDIGRATWPKLTTKSTFHAVQRILDTPERRTQRDNRVVHVLGNVALCGEHEEKGLLPTANARPAPILPTREDITYTDERCAAVRQMYLSGWRAVVPQIRITLSRAGYGETDDETARGLRAEVEEREPELAQFPIAPPPHLKSTHKTGVIYGCSTHHDTSLLTGKMDAYVFEGVVQWLSSPASLAAFTRPDKRDQQAKARRLLKGLTDQIEEARQLSHEFDEDGTPRLSALSLAGMEKALKPKILAAQQRVNNLRDDKISPVLQSLLGNENADQVWDSLEIPEQRTVLRQIVQIRLFKASRKGARQIEPGRITLTFVGEDGFPTSP
jgi:DNA invertase Pin-like site-specific DNA recombinase